MLVLGLGDGFNKSEIMEMMVFGLSHNKIEKLSNNSPEFLNLSLKQDLHINNQNDKK